MSEKHAYGDRRATPPVLRPAGAAALAFLLAALPALAAVTFQDPLDNKPLDIPMPEGDKRTPAVQRFHETGENAYTGDSQAAADGKRVWQNLCQSCHLPDGTGRMGPSLVDEDWNYPRTPTALGKFEVLWAGATGAMQSFKTRMSQDEMLRVIAYMDQLRAQKAGAK